jgi:ubiquinone/menaquinone biosynthesis C-methylase UbiE
MSSPDHLYIKHPLSAESILARIRRNDGRHPTGLTERDLAEDDETQITDQNHVGGVGFVEELARDAHVSSDTSVLDLGSGLGGPARWLAYRYGCCVVGVDVSESRARDAEKLTGIVGLQRHVRFVCGDFLRIDLPEDKFDVLWGQGAWNHIENKPLFIGRWTPVLKRGGRIAFEDCIINRLPTDKQEARLLRNLSESWAAYMIGVKEWTDVLRDVGYSVSCLRDLSKEMLDDIHRMLSAISRLSGYPREESSAFSYAVALLRTGVIGYLRVVAVKT